MLKAKHVGQLGGCDVDQRVDNGQNDRELGNPMRAEVTAARFAEIDAETR